MNNLGDVAQHLMDLYYQQYKSATDFFELIHFKFLASAAYGKILQDEYKLSYDRNRAEEGIGSATLNPEWFIPEDVEIVMSDIGDREAKLKQPFFTFRFDKQFSGIQEVTPMSPNKCGEFIRLGIDEKWKLKMDIVTDVVFWYPVTDKIIFHNVKCGLKKATIFYIPSLSELKDESPIPLSMTDDIVTRVLQIMFAARQGAVIDMTNDGNPNKVIESEINTAFQKIRG